MQIGGGSAFALMVPGTGRLYRLLHCRPSGFDPGLIGGMPAVSGGSGFIGGIIAGLPCRLCGESHQHEAETAAEYGSPEPIPIIPLVSSLIVVWQQ